MGSIEVARFAYGVSVVLLLSWVPNWIRLYRWIRPTGHRVTACWLALALLGATVEAALGVVRDPRSGAVVAASLVASVLWATLLVAVLGARVDSQNSWHVVVGSFVVIMLFPLMEQGIAGRPLAESRVALDGLRCLVLALVGLLAVANYSLTPLGLPVTVGALGLWTRLVGIGPWTVGYEFPMRAAGLTLLAAALWWAVWRQRLPRALGELEAVWLLFRDAWGLAWATRVMTRWNAAAQYRGWKATLNWNGPKVTDSLSPEALEELLCLMRRFAPRSWLLESSRSLVGPS
jgi:hypothetical protein